MNRWSVARWSCAAALLVAAGACAAVAFAAAGATPISSVTVADPAGDEVAGGPDITSVTYTVLDDGTLTLSATFSNRSDSQRAESMQWNLTTQGGGSLNLATFAGYPSQLSVWDGTAWSTVHQLPDPTWSGNTLTLSVALQDLQDAVHQPVTPTLGAIALSVVQTGQSVSTYDTAPADGQTVFSTVPNAKPAPAPTTTRPAPAPKPAPTAPRLAQATKRTPAGKLEWTKLVVSAIPAGARASIACTKGCRLSERLTAAHGTAASKRFVRVPFARGTAFVVRVVRANGTGWWWRDTVARSASTASGCVAKGGRLVAGTGC
jgi:hypothetical protein